MLIMWSGCEAEEHSKKEPLLQPQKTGVMLFAEKCHGCHNYRSIKKEIRIPNYSVDKLEKLITAYQKGKHKRYIGSLLESELRKVTDTEIKALAEYIVKLNNNEVPHLHQLEGPPIAPRKEDPLVVVKKKLQPLDTKSKEYLAFKKEKHRFVLNPCAMSYNEKPIWFGMSVEELRLLLGKEILVKKSEYVKGVSYRWTDKGFHGLFYKNKLYQINLYLNKDISSEIESKYITNNSIVIFNAILKANNKMHELVNKTVLQFRDFDFDPYVDYSISFSCKNNTVASYFFDSKVPYSTVGFGHLVAHDEFLSDETDIVYSISIEEVKE